MYGIAGESGWGHRLESLNYAFKTACLLIILLSTGDRLGFLLIRLHYDLYLSTHYFYHCIHHIANVICRFTQISQTLPKGQ